MSDRERADGTVPASEQRVVRCRDLDAAIAHHVGLLGFRLDMIMPADAPRVAVVSRDATVLRLEAERPATPASDDGQTLLVSRAGENSYLRGRAGMLYRDLIPGRLGGSFIASHIRIADGGPVPDDVHYHRVRFQMIYCRQGWVRVVYEDQGPPFVMHEGDCVLQPPGIRHRVLESSAGLEVIEVASPAEHETLIDHALLLPTAVVRPERDFAGQRFVRHIAGEATWRAVDGQRLQSRDTGIAAATAGLAGVRALRLAHGAATDPRVHDGEFLLFSILSGRATLRLSELGDHMLDANDACVVPAGVQFALEARPSCELLEVALPAH